MEKTHKTSKEILDEVLAKRKKIPKTNAKKIDLKNTELLKFIDYYNLRQQGLTFKQIAEIKLCAVCTASFKYRKAVRIKQSIDCLINSK